MALSGYQRFGYRLFSGIATQRARDNPRLQGVLQQAHINMRPEVFLASTYMTTAIVFVTILFGVILIIAGVFGGALTLAAQVSLFLVPLPLVMAGIVYVVSMVLPDLRVQSRSHDIEAKLPYAINFVATMASAGATPGRIFRSLSEQPIYGEVANEAAWISRDMEALGADVLTALSQAIGRSPSPKFQDFLQGAITTLSTGGDLKAYFNNKGEQYMLDNRQIQAQFLESLGVLAESFVVVVVAAPLFLMVILSVMTSLGGDGQRMLAIGYMLVLLMLPLAQFGFAMALKFSTPEA